MKYIYLLLFVLLSGCYTEQKATKDLDKAKKKFPEKTAKFTRDNFPCNTTDSTIIYDTVYREVEVLCPPSTVVYTTDTLYKNKVDTLHIKGQTKLVKTIVRVPVKQETIIKWYEDSAKIFLANKEIERYKNETNLYMKKSEKKSDWIKWLLILLGVSIILNVLSLRK